MVKPWGKPQGESKGLWALRTVLRRARNVLQHAETLGDLGTILHARVGWIVETESKPTARHVNQQQHTFRLPAITRPPSGAQLKDKPSDPSGTVSRQFLFRTSQNLQVPSSETEASSASLTGFQATCSMAPAWPRSSVLYLTSAFSGFQTRSVLSAAPVAMRVPSGFQATVRILAPWSAVCTYQAEYVSAYPWEPGPLDEGS